MMECSSPRIPSRLSFLVFVGDLLKIRCEQYAEALDRCLRSGLTAVQTNDGHATRVYKRLQVCIGEYLAESGLDSALFPGQS